MPTTELAQILHRRDTAANWLLADPIMGAGEFGVETDTKLVKVGDGTSLWSVLTYQGPQLAAQINLATAKTTPVDADVFPLSDSAAANGLKKITWANIKATLKAYFDTIYSVVATTVTLTGTQTLTNKTIIDPKITRTFNNQTGTAYEFVLADQDKEVTASNAAAVAFSVPTNASVAYPIGASIYGKNLGAGLLTIAAVTSATTTIRSLGTVPTAPTIPSGGSYSIIKIATDIWFVTDDVVATAPVAGSVLLSTTTLAGLTTTISSINQTYRHLFVITKAVEGGNIVSCDPNGATLFNGYQIKSAIVSKVNTKLTADETYANGGDTTGNKSFLWIYDYASTTRYKNIDSVETGYNTGGAYFSCKLFGMIKTNAAITSLVYSASAGGFGGASTVEVWGVN